jgi:hypothetical protein
MDNAYLVFFILLVLVSGFVLVGDWRYRRRALIHRASFQPKIIIHRRDANCAEAGASRTPKALPASDAQKQFIYDIAERYQQRAMLDLRQALECAQSTYDAFIEMEGVEFGHPDYDWSQSGAWDLADEDLTYWDD